MGKTFSQREAALFLEISYTTVENWVRHGYLSKGTKGFEEDALLGLKIKLESGELNRLNGRANKSASRKQFIPSEYIGSADSKGEILVLLNLLLGFDLDIELALFLLSLNLFIKNGDISYSDNRRLLKFSPSDYKRDGVYNHIVEWKSSLLVAPSSIKSSTLSTLLKVKLPDIVDLLGILYQSLIHEGSKSQLGSYYTPKNIVTSLFSTNYSDNSLFLDPCCGTGQFLLAFSQFTSNPTSIFGFDIDKRGVNIAKSNLLLCFSHIDFTPNIFCENSLLIDNSSFLGKFDIIATNPPWGAKYSRDIMAQIRVHLDASHTKESFSFFIYNAFRFLKQGGELKLVLPDSIATIQTHREIRRFILDNFQIERISILGKPFRNVLSSVIAMEMRKEQGGSSDIEITNASRCYTINQTKFEESENSLFSINIDSDDRPIIEKMEERESFSLKGKAKWALGIVTGDNRRFIMDSLPSDEYEPIYKGRDIFPFRLGAPKSFIKYQPELFQQVAGGEIYRAKEKLIYKFISNKLVFAYDNRGALTLNSANILIPEVEGYPIKIFLAFLNSTLFNFYFRKKFGAIKILRGDLEQLPFPTLNENEKKRVLQLVDSNKPDRCELDNYIFNLYSLSSDERLHIVESF